MSGNPLAAAEPWNLVADGYADLAPLMMRPFAARTLELAALTADSRVIDVAAGPGTLSLLAAEQVVSVQAIDFSEPMIARLDHAAEAAGLANIEAQVGDGQALPFPEGQFDAAFSMFGLMFFPDRPRGFAELFRVLRPGGVAVVSSWAPIAESSFMRMMFAALGAADPNMQEPQPNFLNLENPEVFEVELGAAGFDGVTIQRHTATLAFADAGEMCDLMLRGSAPMTLLRRSLDEQEWTRRTTLMRGYLTQNYQPNQPLSTTAFLGVAHKPGS